MRYLSTRGAAEPLEFEDVLLEGLARDGGLYVPETWPTLKPDDVAGFAGKPYADVAEAVMRPFAGGVDPAALRAIIDRAYTTFRVDEIAPLKPLDAIAPNLHLLELWHGPTLAFKDVAMQVLGGLFDHVLEKRGERVTIIGATSGDTGSAAIEAVRRCEHASIFILHPHGRTSEVQRRQMTTVDAPNVHNLAVEGTFDDCQAAVKAMFGDGAFRDEVSLGAVNSINWARIVAQSVYYVTSALTLGAENRPVSYVVPTGNFGDVFAGYVAKRMGAPVGRLVVATNDNDILDRTLRTGRHEPRGVAATTSPSMDIEVSSNFERLLYEATGRDAEAVRALMDRANQGRYDLPADAARAIEAEFSSHRASEAEVDEAMRAPLVPTDPHTAVGLVAAAKARRDGLQGPLVTLSTAHPAKFPDAVEAATGDRPALPRRLSGLMEAKERYARAPNDLAALRQAVRAHVAR